jgi:hypothetical protein
MSRLGLIGCAIKKKPQQQVELLIVISKPTTQKKHQDDKHNSLSWSYKLHNKKNHHDERSLLS